jgi:hypothetical protein
MHRCLGKSPGSGSETSKVSARTEFLANDRLGHYAGLVLRIRARRGRFPVIGGGFIAWAQALLADRKERLLASAGGSELVCKAYAPA